MPAEWLLDLVENSRKSIPEACALVTSPVDSTAFMPFNIVGDLSALTKLLNERLKSDELLKSASVVTLLDSERWARLTPQQRVDDIAQGNQLLRDLRYPPDVVLAFKRFRDRNPIVDEHQDGPAEGLVEDFRREMERPPEDWFGPPPVSV